MCQDFQLYYNIFSGFNLGIFTLLGLFLLHSNRQFIAGANPDLVVRKTSGGLIFCMALGYYDIFPFWIHFMEKVPAGFFELNLIMGVLIGIPCVVLWLLSLLRLNNIKNIAIRVTAPLVIPAVLAVWYLFTANRTAFIACFIFWALYLMIFGIRYVLEVIRYRRILLDNFSYDRNHRVAWLIYSVIILALILSSFLMSVIWRAQAVSPFIFVHLALSLLFCIFFAYVSLGQVAEKETLGEEPSEPAGTDGSSDADDDSRDAWIGKRLSALCEKERIFLNPEMNSQMLSKAVGTNRTYLSKYFNGRGVNFSHYVNSLRIDYAKKLIGASVEKPNVTTLAQECGYKQLNSFRTAFKASTGMLPSEYINKVFEDRIMSEQNKNEKYD